VAVRLNSSMGLGAHFFHQLTDELDIPTRSGKILASLYYFS
jgi:hypothetical protein